MITITVRAACLLLVLIACSGGVIAAGPHQADPRFRVALYGPQLDGVVTASVPVTLTLTSGDGTVKAQTVRTSESDGYVSFWFGPLTVEASADGPRFMAARGHSAELKSSRWGAGI